MRRAPSIGTVLRRVKSPTVLLNTYPKRQRPLFFEELVVQALAAQLHLPFYDGDSDDANVPYRATWHGSRATRQKARGRQPDGTIRARGFWLCVEATLSTGSTQWAREFSSAKRHLLALARQPSAPPGSVFGLLVARKLHEDTFEAIRASNAGRPPHIIPLEASHLPVAVETSFLALTLRDLDTRMLIRNLLARLANCHDLAEYRQNAHKCIGEWQRAVLLQERPTMVAIKSYELMASSPSGHMATSQILVALNRQPELQTYFGKIRETPGAEMVVQSLLQESLAIKVGELHTGEQLLEPILSSDFCARSHRRLRAVKNAST